MSWLTATIPVGPRWLFFLDLANSLIHSTSGKRGAAMKRLPARLFFVAPHCDRTVSPRAAVLQDKRQNELLIQRERRLGKIGSAYGHANHF